MNSTEACIALNMLPTMGPVRLRRLLEVFGTPERILTAKRSELRAIDGIGNEVAERCYAKAGFAFAEEKRDPSYEAITGSPGFRRFVREIGAPR